MENLTISSLSPPSWLSAWSCWTLPGASYSSPVLKQVSQGFLTLFVSTFLSGTYWQTGYVVVSHLFVSCLSLLNSQNSGAYYPATIIPSFIVLLVSIALALKIAGATVASFKAALTSGFSSVSGNLQVNAEDWERRKEGIPRLTKLFINSVIVVL